MSTRGRFQSTWRLFQSCTRPHRKRVAGDSVDVVPQLSALHKAQILKQKAVRRQDWAPTYYYLATPSIDQTAILRPDNTPNTHSNEIVELIGSVVLAGGVC